MKKLTKFLFYSAIIASAVFIVSCSDDVVDSNTTKDSGIPFKVSATVNNSGTRASDITTLNNFQIWGFLGDETNQLAGVNCTPATGGYNPSISVNWPVAGQDYTFYALSDNTSSTSNITNNAIAGTTTHSFDYTMPYTEVDGKKIVTIASQKDLLTAAAQGNTTEGLNMHFDHALTAAKMRITLDPSKNPTYYKPNGGPYYIYVMKIQKIILHNIKISGTYTFGDGCAPGATSSTIAQNGSWNTKDGIVGDYVFDFSSAPIFNQILYSGTLNREISLDGNFGNIYYIPQTISSWDITANAQNDNYKTPSATQSYIEIKAIAAVYPYVKLLEELNSFIDEGLFDVYKDMGYFDEYPGITLVKDDAGNFYDDADKKNMIVDKDGYVIDFSSGILTVCENQPTVETSNSPSGVDFFSTIVNENEYGVLYKTFNPTLTVNGNRVFKIEFVNSCRAKDGSGAYGVAVEVTTP